MEAFAYSFKVQARHRPESTGDWPVTRPIYYFNGSRDTNTPLWQARGHFDAQKGARREFVAVVDAGHNPRAPICPIVRRRCGARWVPAPVSVTRWRAARGRSSTPRPI